MTFTLREILDWQWSNRYNVDWAHLRKCKHYA